MFWDSKAYLRQQIERLERTINDLRHLKTVEKALKAEHHVVFHLYHDGNGNATGGLKVHNMDARIAAAVFLKYLLGSDE